MRPCCRAEAQVPVLPSMLGVLVRAGVLLAAVHLGGVMASTWAPSAGLAQSVGVEVAHAGEPCPVKSHR